MKHYTKEELEMYRDCALGKWNRMVCAAHLKKCTECRNRYNTLLKDDVFLREVKNSVLIFNAHADEVNKNK